MCWGGRGGWGVRRGVRGGRRWGLRRWLWCSWFWSRWGFCGFGRLSWLESWVWWMRFDLWVWVMGGVGRGWCGGRRRGGRGMCGRWGCWLVVGIEWFVGWWWGELLEKILVLVMVCVWWIWLRESVESGDWSCVKLCWKLVRYFKYKVLILWVFDVGLVYYFILKKKYIGIRWNI